MGNAESNFSQNANSQIENRSNEPETKNGTPLNKENDDESDSEFIDCTSEFDGEELRAAFDNEKIKNRLKENSKNENLNENISNENNESDVRDCVEVVKSKSYEKINRRNAQQCEPLHDDDSDEMSDSERKRSHIQEMEIFHAEMTKKREFRQKCLQNLRDELTTLREQLTNEKKVNSQLKETIDLNNDAKHMDKLYNENIKLKSEIAALQLSLQTSNGENLNLNFEVIQLRDNARHLKETVSNENCRLKEDVAELEKKLKTLNSEFADKNNELEAFKEQAKSLKEVVAAVKEMLVIREDQVSRLKQKLKDIEEAFVEKEMKIMSTALQEEYQRQLENIRRMRELYEERSNLLASERDEYKEKLRDCEHDLKGEIEKAKNLEEYVGVLENNLKVKNTDISMLESEIGILKSEKAQTQSEMNAINQLISQILLGFNANGNNLDIDKLVSMLEENRDLLNEMAIKEEFSGIEEGSFLPKLLYDLFLQVNTENNEDGKNDEINEPKTPLTVENVAEKLPKVWRVLIELLSHHNKLKEIQLNDDEKELDSCYKSIQTGSGPQAVLSVSKTFIKLKDLIVEKKSLQKDTQRLKTLYSHLECRLDKQEKRLSEVGLELTKTWHLVGKIKHQHKQLHTHEQILCFQLQQKRKLLNELKKELEYCRKKWAMAREKNDESEIQCKLLRQEFTKRKLLDNNSAESGYSDEHPSDLSDDEGQSKNKPESSKVCERIVDPSKFDENLVLFERTISPTNPDRRRSESPLNSEITEIYVYSRAQSEPPDSTYMIEMYNHVTEEILIPQTLQECDNLNIQEEKEASPLIITSPPPILVDTKNSQPKAQLSSSKPKKAKKGKKASKQETAESMFLRLCGYINNETVAESDDEDSSCSEECGLQKENSIEQLIEIELPQNNDTCIEQPIEIELPQNSETCIEDVIGAVCMELMEESTTCEVPKAQLSPSKTEEKPINLTTTEQEYLDRRSARLARLEAEAQEFYNKISKTKERGQKMSSQIDDIHNNFVERERQKEKSAKSEEKNLQKNNESEETNEKKNDEKNDKKDQEEL